MRRNGKRLKEIAEILNLSTGTVSRALSGRGDIAENTRAQVAEVAARIKYTSPRNRLREAKTFRRISICVGQPSALEGGGLDPSFVGFHYIVAIERAASAADLSVLVSFLDPAADAKRLDQMPVLQPRETNGAILLYPYTESFVRSLARRVPVMSIEHVYPSVSVDTIGPAQASDVMLAVEHLHQLGHRRIAYVGDEEARGDRLTSGLRHAGFTSGLTRCGVPYRADDVINVLTPYVVKADLPGWVKARHKDGVTAVITAIDRHGYLLWEQLPAIGVRVPRDLSLVGIGGIPRAADQPQLTTWRCDYETIAKCAIGALQLRSQDGDAAALYREIASIFVSGESTAAPAN